MYILLYVNNIWELQTFENSPVFWRTLYMRLHTFSVLRAGSELMVLKTTDWQTLCGESVHTTLIVVNSRRARRADMLNKSSQSAAVKRQQPTNQRSAGASDSLVVDRCPTCHVVLESYDDETVSLCIVCLATFIHREPALAAPLLLDMLHAVSR